MRRLLRWGLPLLALAIAGLFAARAIQQRRAVAPAAAPADAPAIELAGTDVVELRRVELARTLDITGGLKAVSSAAVKAKVAAEVRQLSVREGDAVKVGQVVATLDTTELDWRVRQAEQTAAASRAQAEIAKRTLDNNKALVAQGFISPTALDNSVASEAAAQATLQASLAAVEIARKARADAVLTAPISGRVSQRFVQPGERVPIDAKLLEIVDLSKIELEAAVAPEDVSSLPLGARATLRIDGIADPVGAKVVRTNPSALAGSRSVMVYLAVEPHPALRQGLFARGTVELSRKATLAAPASSVRIDQARPYVLLLDNGRIVQRPVVPGARGSADGTEMVELGAAAGSPPLAEGARLVAGSVGALRDGASVRVTAPAPAPAPATGQR